MNCAVAHHLRGSSQWQVRWKLRDAVAHHVPGGQVAAIFAGICLDQFILTNHTDSMAFVIQHNNCFQVTIQQQAGDFDNRGIGRTGGYTDGHQVADKLAFGHDRAIS